MSCRVSQATIRGTGKRALGAIGGDRKREEETEMTRNHFYKKVLPFTAMITVECTNVGKTTLFKAATLKGMSYYVFVTYTYAIAALLIFPLLFIFPRFLSQICGYKGIEYSSPTLASALSNLNPAFTFILAIISDQCYEDLPSRAHCSLLLQLMCNLCITTTMPTSRIKLEFLEIKTKCSSCCSHLLGFASSFRNFVHTWGLHKRGPVYIAVFKPVSIAIAAIIGSIFLGEALHLGTVIGATILFLGFYAVIWGKAREERIDDSGFRGLAPLSHEQRRRESETEMEGNYFYKEVLPFTAMVMVECAVVGLNILFKAANLKGMSYYVFIPYACATATLLLFPLLFIFPRFLSLICGYQGIQYSSPTLASAMSNLTPVFTFILAIIFRMERVVLRSTISQAKITGTIVSISGALVIVLYKGPTVFPSASSVSLQLSLGSSESNWIIGGLLLSLEYLFVSIWYIVQTSLMKMYPAELNVVFFYNLCTNLISLPVCLLAESDLSSWRLEPSVAVVAVIYSGFATSFSNFVHTWGVHIKGPVYVAVFKPFSIAIAAFMSTIFLGEPLYLGSVIGATILFIGFYAVMWGKAKEEAMIDNSNLVTSSEDQLPSLQSNEVEDSRKINARK
ncbi:hypothetical protein SLEP1_g20178 [Rubroshorea leprosula]|uniref:WAT1-related protein n=1 Tax=Rubroshorea leprosula TaxID=152421 RepID=A0AAV5JCH2_9ROSI|nr:hypothetical protein SLEP1_g20178 [Rubroshorea leprosula]